MGNRPDAALPLVGNRRSPLSIYAHYRVLIAGAVAGLFIANIDNSLTLGGYRPQLFLVTSIGYFFLALLSSLTVPLLVRRDTFQASVLIGIDIIALTVLAHASGGAASLIPTLIVVTVAAGGILLTERMSLVVAAAATLAMLYEQFYFALENRMPLTEGSTRVGLLGLAFFGIALATSQLARRVRTTEEFAWQRSQAAVDLEHLNAHIIQRMRTGILVVDADGIVQLANSAAQHMLAVGGNWHNGTPLASVCPELVGRLARWRQEADFRAPPFRSHPGGAEVDASMAAIRLGAREATLVFLEDMTMLSQHLQQMKLASLGRLTASIAHEIRNPLSAINHASQLLAESPSVGGDDRRLTDIIQQQTLRLDRTVESVLQLSRRQMPRSDLLELVAWLRQFRSDYLALHGKSDDEVLVEPRASWVRARFDPNHLQQILQNLCDNGLRHGGKLSGRGVVTLEPGTSETDELPVLRILDNGPGVAPEKLGNLFEPFFTTEASGTGLGLYIARELCEANRARLAYIPAAGDGKPGYFQITFAHPGRIAS